MFISDNTISTIENTSDGYKLTLYNHKIAVFSKTYKTYTGAAIAQTKMLKKYDTLVQGQQREKTMLFHDEIKEILRNATHGAILAIGDFRIRIAQTAIDCDGVKVSSPRFYDTKTGFEKWEHVIIDRIYDAIESGATVTIDARDILKL